MDDRRLQLAEPSQHFIARSQTMQEELQLAARVAPIDTTVLVLGETGTSSHF